ncbi:MAG TPA: AAA family ATPase [Candidatus Limnocylindrales bacterium]|nr:AAA family ATPase [Candidatus Limnocylindrales bacterium]
MRTRDGAPTTRRPSEPVTHPAGREGELGAVRSTIDDALGGRVSVCTFVGAAGAGKTTVWRAAVGAAHEAGFRVLSCAPVAQEAALGYAALADVLRDVERDRFARLPPPQRHAVLAALQEEEGAGSVPEHAAAAGLRAVLAALAGEGPLCIAADDLQWMDRSSMRALGFALRRIEGAPLLVVGARRQNASTGHVERDAPPGSSVRVVRLSELSVAAMHHVLHQALGTTFPRPTLVRITTLSKGNPLLAIELARSVLSTGTGLQPGERAPLAGPNVRRLLGRRIATLSDAQRRTLLVGALVEGGSLDQARAAHAALGWPFEPPPPGTGLIDIRDHVIAFEHPLFAEAVLAAAAPDEAMVVHRTIADLTVRADVRARHLAEAAPAANADMASAIDAAVSEVLAAGATDEAVALTGLALERTPADDPRRDGRLLRHVDLVLRSGDTTTATALLETALAETVDPAQRVQLLLRLASTLSASRPASEIRPICEEAIRLAAGDIEAVARAELILSDVSVTPDEGLRHARRATRALGPSGPPAVRARAITMAALWRSQAGRHVPIKALDAAVALEDEGGVESLVDASRFARAWFLLMEEELDAARRDFETLREEAVGGGDEGSLVVIDAQLGHLEIRAGNWRRASEISIEMLRAAEMSGALIWAGLAHMQLAQAHGLSGDLGRAGHHLEATEAIANKLDDPFLRWVALKCRALLALAAERYLEAAAFGLSAQVAHAGRADDPALDPWPGIEAEAAARLGRLDQARALTGELERRARARRRRRALAVVARCRALIEASEGDLAAAVGSARTSVRALSAMPVPFDHARSLLVLGSIQRRRREKRAADDTLVQALRIFERLGAVAWIRQTQAERARIGLRPRAPLTLTDGELRIARLAAAGRSNREIAQEVFLSQKTVEANLARAYQKLGIRRRAELGTRLAGLEPARPD